MIVSLIVATDENGGIGFDNQIPWHLPADLARFKKLTMGHYLIAGRKTYESIGGALPGRHMIVLTRNPEFNAPDCFLSESLADAFDLAEENGEKEVFIIGGAEIYREALPLADRLYLTVVHTETEADTFFPEIAEEAWTEVCSQEFSEDEKNTLATTFIHLVRR